MIKLLLILLWLENSCRALRCQNTICTWQYMEINRPYPVGCNETSMRTTVIKSRISCAMSCTDDLTCAAFVYSGQLKACSLCQGDFIQQLNFSTDVTVFWKVQNVAQNMPLNPLINYYSTIMATITYKIYLGSLIHLHGYYYNLEGFFIDLPQDFLGANVTFHFRSRRDFDTGVPILALSNSFKNSWASERRPPAMPYPFRENTTFNLDILVGYTGYQVYIDHIYCCQYPHNLSYSDSKFVRIIGKIKVYELFF